MEGKEISFVTWPDGNVSGESIAGASGSVHDRVGAVRQKIVDAYLAGALDAARALGAFLLSKDITAAEIAKWMTAGALRGRAERYALKQSSDSVTEPKTNQP